jgi:L-ascorbate metabolism protein UlaG (beta-lactamase superfamily)
MPLAVDAHATSRYRATMNRRRFMKIAGLAALAASAGGFFASRAEAANRYYTGPASDHFDGVRFFNPDGTPPGSFTDLLRWQFGGNRVPWPPSFESPFPPAVPEPRIEGDATRVTMVGHATLLIQTAGLNILSDPVWSERASPVGFAGPRRVNPPGIALEHLPPIDIVLVTHNHYDHLDLDTLARIEAAHAPFFVTPLGNDTIIRERIPDARIAIGDWGDVVEIGGARLHFEPCHHWSARGTRDRRMALWSAFVIETAGGRIYHVGDTGFHRGINYRAAAEKHGGFRLAILPFGAYEPRWFMKGQHQNPAEAVDGMELAGADNVAGHHWGTFRLTDEGIEEPVEALHAALDAKGIDRARFRPMRPGEVWDVPAGPA